MIARRLQGLLRVRQGEERTAFSAPSVDAGAFAPGTESSSRIHHETFAGAWRSSAASGASLSPKPIGQKPHATNDFRRLPGPHLGGAFHCLIETHDPYRMVPLRMVPLRIVASGK
jgi:hypothetical protein